jgi:hypothetical protein
MSDWDFLRSGYRLVVRMHPRMFRERFGEEMVWIFDEERRRGGGARVFFDGVVSLARQRSKMEEEARPVLAGFGLLDPGPWIAPRRFVQAGVAASLFLAGFMLLLGRTGKIFAGPVCVPGVPRSSSRLLHAPSRIQPLRKGEASLRSGIDVSGVNNGAAGAVRMVRASSSAAGSCPAH